MPGPWECPERPPSRRTVLAALLILLVVFATGCETPSLTAAYASANKPELRPMPKPENRLVNLDVRDARPVRDPALLQALRNHLESGLQARGFLLGNEGTLLEVAIEHHYFERKTGFWLSSESAELIVRCRVGDPDGRVRLDKTFTGRSGTLKITASPPVRTRAFEDLLLQLLNDDECLRALGGIASGKGPP